MCAYNLPYNEDVFLQIQHEFNALYEHVSEPVSALDLRLPGLPFVAVNQAFASMHGYEIEELIGLPQDTIHPEDRRAKPEDDSNQRATALEFLQQEGSSHGRSLHVHKSGAIFTVAYVSRLEKLAGVELLVAVDNYFSSKEAVAPTFSWQSVFQKLSEPMSEGVVLADPQNSLQIIECNDSFAAFSGYTRDELIGERLGDFSEQQDPVRYANWLQHELSGFVEQIRSVGTFQYEMFYKHRNGNKNPIFLSCTLVEIDKREYLLYTIRNLVEERFRRSLDTQRDRVLQSIATNKPLVETLNQIATFAEQQIADSCCAVLLWQNRWQVKAAPSLSNQDIRALEAYSELEESAIQQSHQTGLPFFTAPKEQACLPHLKNQLYGCWTFPIQSTQQRRAQLVILVNAPTRSPQYRDTQAMQQAVSLATIAIDQNQRLKKLEHQAEHDHLTDLPNRLLLEDRLQQALLKSERDDDRLAVFMLDLDGFKRVNDSLGHSAGDWLLQQVARRLQNCVRRSDTVARLGGDEFTVLLPHFQQQEDVTQVAEKIIAAIQQPFHFRDHDIFVTTSIGIAISRHNGTDVSTLLRNADTAMYRAKTGGKNRYEFFDSSMSQALEQKFDLTHQLRIALSRNEFEIYYQPQIQLGSPDRLVGFEALLRWRHPKLGMILPPRFIPTAEESGIILQIGSWVINEVCRQMRDWQDSGMEPLRVTVNISALQFGRKEFLDGVRDSLSTHRIQPELLEMDLTEDIVMRDQSESQRQLMRLQELGIGLAIDDFGTGYSSLSYLQQLPLNRIKLDQSFVQNLGHSPHQGLLVQAIIALGHSLKLQVLAEGVNCAQQLAVLRELRCDLVQGYFLAPAMPTTQIPSVVERYSNEFPSRTIR